MASIWILPVSDPDVLDTWFSSGLFPFAMLGWPEQVLHFLLHNIVLNKQPYPFYYNQWWTRITILLKSKYRYSWSTITPIQVRVVPSNIYLS